MAVTVPEVSAFTPVTTGPAAQMTASTIDPNTVAQVTPSTVQQSALTTPTVSTTQDQLTGILNKGGPLMQQAATVGNQQAASRGLLNSSMGIQAAQAAVLDKAVPIANADANATNQVNLANANTLNTNLQTTANTQNQVGTWNAGAVNQTAQTNQSAENQAASQNTTAQNTMIQTNTQNANAAAQWNAGQQNQAITQAMDLNSRETLANIEADYKQIMQVNSSAGTLYEQVMKNISDIQTNKDIADKPTAINSQLAWLKSGMEMIQNLNGITGLVTFGTTATPTP